MLKYQKSYKRKICVQQVKRFSNVYKNKSFIIFKQIKFGRYWFFQRGRVGLDCFNSYLIYNLYFFPFLPNSASTSTKLRLRLALISHLSSHPPTHTPTHLTEKVRKLNCILTQAPTSSPIQPQPQPQPQPQAQLNLSLAQLQPQLVQIFFSD